MQDVVEYKKKYWKLLNKITNTAKLYLSTVLDIADNMHNVYREKDWTVMSKRLGQMR